MNTTPQILVAKYAADLLRMEPRNAGVVIWSPHGIVARFLGEQPDGRVRAPRIVPPEGRHAYKEWISYWRIILARETIRDDAGEQIPKSSAEYVRVLQSKSKSSFMLIDAGFMREQVGENALPEIADECFEVLVQEPAITWAIAGITGDQRKAPTEGHLSHDLEVMRLAEMRSRLDSTTPPERRTDVDTRGNSKYHPAAPLATGDCRHAD